MTATSQPALLFDLDGTLVDTRLANYAAYQAALGEEGITFSEQQFAATWGRDARDFLRELVPGGDAAAIERIRRSKAEVYPTHLHLTEANDALITVLRLARTVTRTALVTTAKRANAEAVLQAHGLDDAFDLLVTGDDVSRSKPDPEPYLVALETLSLRPEDAIAFEDSESGIASATAAGIRVVKVAFGG